MALRCFIAVEIPDAMKEAVHEIIAELKKTGADVKWVPAENIHITLKFLGNTEEGLVEAIKEGLSKKLTAYHPFYIKISGIGYFPAKRPPRVIWVGIEESGDLLSLYEAVESEVVRLGFIPEERPFSPHLTIGRVKSARRTPQLLEKIEKIRQLDFGSLEVKEASLMKSELRPKGAEYHCLAKIPFGGRKHDE